MAQFVYQKNVRLSCVVEIDSQSNLHVYQRRMSIVSHEEMFDPCTYVAYTLQTLSYRV